MIGAALRPRPPRAASVPGPASPPAFTPRPGGGDPEDRLGPLPAALAARVPRELLPATVQERLAGERLLIVVRPTPKAVLAAALPIAALLLVFLVLPLLAGPVAEFLFRPFGPPEGESLDPFTFFGILGFLEAPFFVIGALLVGRFARAVGLLFTTYVVTEKEVVSHFSFLAERIRQVPHEKITDLAVRQGLVPRLLGYGEVHVEAYTQGAHIEMRGVGPSLELLHLLSDRARKATSVRYLLESD